MLFCRFICATVLHLALLDETNRGLEHMKYALNHSYDFEDYRMAWVYSFLQCLITILVEFNNMMVILYSISPVAMGENFLALAIIADFDNFVFEAISHEPLKLLLEEETA